MMRGFSRRGQPLLALLLLVGGWVSARAVMWQPDPLMRIGPIAGPVTLASRLPQPSVSPERGLAGMSVAAPFSLLRDEQVRDEVYAETLPVPVTAEIPADPASVLVSSPAVIAPAPRLRAPSVPTQLAPQAPGPEFAPVPVSIAAGHQLLYMAALAHVPLPAGLTGLPRLARRTPVPFYPAGQEPLANPRRWSADAWMLWRRGSTGAPVGGLLTPSYGASQAGVVLRYRLAPESGHRPAAYLRATAALNGSNEREAALGLTARPFARMPIAIAGEARFTSAPGGKFVRPAAYAVTELPPFALPFGTRGEAYGQAGYVGGKFATAFADGQIRVDRGLLRLGKGELRLGGGVWAGIQKGASRVDAGPSLTLGQPLGGPAAMRLAADWRFRVAGKAAPGSGPAVTLSAGF